ncbi:Hypothetical_protein [Hexamita inflata]|uniref:Hypothetical_protein n=1 Tax=Hexamita inflata TaxID=28002 RepID=A0ABP1HPZ5_9EUKA
MNLTQSATQFSNLALSSSYIQVADVELNFYLKASGQILQIAAANQVNVNNILIKQFSNITIGNQVALCAPFNNCFVIYNLTTTEPIADPVLQYFNKTHKIPTVNDFVSQASSFLYKYTSPTDKQYYFVSTANFAQKQLDETGTAVYLGYCANISTCWCNATVFSPFCTCDSVNQRLFQSQCLVQTNDPDGSIYVTSDSKKYFKCPATPALPGYVLNENLHACFTQCDSSCSNAINSTFTANCVCECSVPVKIVDNKCTEICANESFYFDNDKCFEKCSNCMNGNAYLDGKQTVYYECNPNYNLQNGQCVKTTKSTNQFIIGISVGSGCLAVVAIVLVSVKGCLQMKKNRAQRV